MPATRTTRSEDEAVLSEHHGVCRASDEALMQAAFNRFGWRMLSDDAAMWLADRYEAAEARRNEINESNRQIRGQAA
ncbi:hypothetical protein ASG40_11520 [Methylobacterium sp. Leaf399]|uniref:hypothetical protein n=1 Tax=Methylobacterium sp. Leaf399 TaxID=1736364 RepID=UPI0006F4BD88|nr:hypothetical protein [Methylobacterium sp. Leaf399]KQT08503.1 hypothetical protein ASG40_11520 [Methylobacterium sp. Leaf399]